MPEYDSFDRPSKIEDDYSFVTPKIKEKIIRLFEVQAFWLADNEMEGYCCLECISTGRVYEWIHFLSCYPSPSLIPKHGDMIQGYLSINNVNKETKVDNNTVKKLKWGPYCHVEGCLEILDFDESCGILCQIPDEDEFIIVENLYGFELKIGDHFTFSGSPCIREGLHDYKVINGERVTWIMSE